MNTIKHLAIYFIVLFFSITPCFAQLGTIGKATVKSGVKSGLKTVVKKQAKSTAKDIVIQNIKKKSIKSGVKSTVTSQIGRELTEATVKNVSRQAIKEVKNELIEKSIKIAGKKTLNKEMKKLANGIIGKSANNYLTEKRKKFVINSGKELSDNFIKNNLERDLPLSIAIEKSIGKTGLNEVEKYLPSISSKQILVDDLLQKPQLAKLFQKNPTLVKNYAQCINSKLRTDISKLRYLNYYADSYADACFFSKGKYLRAGNLQFIDDKRGNTIIRNATTGEDLGIIIDDVIQITSNHSLLNMRLMKNMKYQVDNSIFTTDKLGRPIEVKASISPKFKNTIIYDRDKIVQRDFRKARTNASKLDSNKLNDDAGHLLAHDLGGVSDGINLVPQNRSLNRGGYKKMENLIKKDVKKGHSAEITIKLNYKGASERPSSYTYEYKKDGNIVKSVIFDNIMETNN